MGTDICWSQLYGPLASVVKISKALKKHPVLYLDVEQLGDFNASVMHDAIHSHSSEADEIRKRIYPAKSVKNLLKLDLRDLGEWYSIKIMGPSKMRNGEPVNMEKVMKDKDSSSFNVLMMSHPHSEWLVPMGGKLLTREEVDAFIITAETRMDVSDMEFIIVDVVGRVKPQKSLQRRIEESKQALTQALGEVMSLVKSQSEEAVVVMDQLTKALTEIKSKNAV